MIFFITCLRALAACLITNAHYTGIYPTDIIANGGLIGDVLFFAVSGYCLYNVKLPFLKWYGKRLWRVFLPVWIGTGVLILTGGYVLDDMPLYQWFVYPTAYHFVASIIILYVPFYFIAKSEWLKIRIPLVMGVIASVMLVVYIVWYDKSYYHIDAVREWFIRFLFMESMLLGAYFKQNDKKFRNIFSLKYPIACIISFGMYFVSKIFFSKNPSFGNFQIINQALIFVLLYFVFRTFAGLDSRIEKFPGWVKVVICFIADMTLEIYIVQYVLIDRLRPVGHFPLNWIAITAAIIISAFVLHMVCKYIYKFFDVVLQKVSRHKGTV